MSHSCQLLQGLFHFLVAMVTSLAILQSLTRPAVCGEKRPLKDQGRFETIFDGKTLEGWEGDPKYWRVEDGTLIGEVTPKTLLKQNSWLLWRGGLVKDFELVLDYRVSASGNSGIGYRCAEIEGQPFAVRGPQADIDGGVLWSGQCYEEGGRRFLAARGQVAWIEPGRMPRLIGQFADPASLQEGVKKEDWNRYRLVVQGNHAKHWINEVLMCEVHDHDNANRLHQGLLGVQVHVGPPMKIEYRNIRLKRLGQRPAGAATRGAVSYRPMQLLEFDHQASFAHVKKETARLTAPVTAALIDGGKEEVVLVTRNLAVVRQDLENVAPFGGGGGKMKNASKEFDLVVTSGDRAIRVARAGTSLKDRPLNQAYRIRLKWNGDAKRYEALEISPAPRDNTPPR